MSDDETLVAERQAKLDALGPRPAWWRLLARRRWKHERARICAMDVSKATAMFRRLYTPAAIEQALRPHPMLSVMGKVKHFESGAFSYTVVREDDKP